MREKTSLAAKFLRKLSGWVLGEDYWIKHFGTFREREAHGLVNRANYCYGMLRAADLARYLGSESVTVIEFGVASGSGLLNMIELAELINNETGVKFKIVGFDAGSGLPSVSGYRDHAELWVPGDFSMSDRDELLSVTGDRAQIIFGDIADTLEPFRDSDVLATAPVGFVSLDVDIHSASVSALKLFESSSAKYLPAVSLYLDDAGFFFANKWCGELLAVEQFNARHELRKIYVDRSLTPMRRRADSWYPAMHVAHILDHEVRNEGFSRTKLSIPDHNEFMRSRNLY